MYQVVFDTEPTLPKAKLEARVTELEALIKKNLDLQFGGDDFKARQKLQRAFSTADYLDKGTVDRPQFDVALKSLNVLPEKQVASYWFSLYAPDSDGAFDYHLFSKSMYGVVIAPSRDKVCKQAVEQVRTKILERGAGAMRGLSQAFRIMDTNRNQKLSGTELRNGLMRYGIELDDDAFAHVVRAFDRDNNGISVTEFLSTLRGHLNDRRRQLVQLAYQQLDKDGSGVVEFKEIAGIYDATRHPEVLAGRLSVEDVLLEFIKSWDRDGDGRITLLEFLDYYKDLSCSIDNDDYFELMIRNAWHLAGGKGWCANTSNLRVLVVHEDDSEEVVCITNDLGLDKDDDAALRAKLTEQGVQNIKRVELAF